ncbi:hypothetical protein JOB18_048759 [Solea senegalensis]|uniref:Uncharacterized protein n=1 Tax=Solea senegalensis TaxID=28829 RepID=A0AAV6RHG1_SOLSE|nr:hypothetical protein JOB18_048759 [Solea senegalensis]
MAAAHPPINMPHRAPATCGSLIGQRRQVCHSIQLGRYTTHPPQSPSPWRKPPGTNYTNMCQTQHSIIGQVITYSPI